MEKKIHKYIIRNTPFGELPFVIQSKQHLVWDPCSLFAIRSRDNICNRFGE